MSPSLQHLTDASVSTLYENIRQQVELDRPNNYQFVSGEAVRERADELRSELIRRKLFCMPIDW